MRLSSKIGDSRTLSLKMKLSRETVSTVKRQLSVDWRFQDIGMLHELVVHLNRFNVHDKVLYVL